MNNLSCWVLTSDKKGTIHQACGVPIRLGINPEYKTIKLSRFAKILGHINIRLLGFFKEIRSLNNLPNLIVSSGHDGLLAAAYLKAKNPSLITVHIQNPGSLIKYFNLAAVPKHDNAKFCQKYKDRVIITQLGLHHITEQNLIDEGNKFAKEFGILKPKIFFSVGKKSSESIKNLNEPTELGKITKPTIFFSIGGKSAGYDLTDEWIEKFCKTVILLQEKYQVFITTARRTKADHRLKIKQSLANTGIILLDNYEYNYYIGVLAKCDFIFVTCESVSMISEACFTKKRIFVLKIPGFRKKIQNFTDNLAQKKYITYADIDNIVIGESSDISAPDDNIIVGNAVKNILIKYGKKL